MRVIVAIANQKGGTAKTTTTVSLGAALARKGVRVMIVDLDPQASLTEYFMNPADLEASMYHVMLEDRSITPIAMGPNIRLLPTNIDLAASEIALPKQMNFERRLARRLRDYDDEVILLDCPPSLGVLTRNALSAARFVIVPVATEKMAVRTIPLILDQVDEVKESELNADLEVWRILPTLYSAREREDNTCLQEIREGYGEMVYSEPVARRTNYKKAVREQVDVADIDGELGTYWDVLAERLLEEVR